MIQFLSCPVIESSHSSFSKPFFTFDLLMCICLSVENQVTLPLVALSYSEKREGKSLKLRKFFNFYFLCRFFLHFFKLSYWIWHFCYCIFLVLTTSPGKQLETHLTLKCRHPKKREFCLFSLLIREKSTTVKHHKQFECWWCCCCCCFIFFLLSFLSVHSVHSFVFQAAKSQ